MKVALFWFRRDLRLRDNTALHAAVAAAETVWPVFIFDPAFNRAPDRSSNRVAFMLECLRALEQDIEAAGCRLLFRRGPVEEEMREVLRTTGAQALYYNRDYEPYTRRRDAAVEKLARSLGVQVRSYQDAVLCEPDEVLKPDGKPYVVFTPYSQASLGRARSPVLPGVKFSPSPPLKEAMSIPRPTLEQLGFSADAPVIPGGETAARDNLRRFVTGALRDYAQGRDVPDRDATSRLSPHLHFGTLSPRTIVLAAEGAGRRHPEAARDVAVFIKELAWRDFYRQILWHFPHVAESCFQPQYDALKWENNEKLFAAWCAGRTGYPLVDAGMRQLNATGWMHNRLRMVTATFLTKDLLVSWQWGERYFMQKLADGDLASNNGGWQWCASTGTDAQPYFRIFNPTTQAKKFDPEGRFIRRYVPEVDTPAYPKPIVDHAEQRLKALAMFKA